MSITDNHDYSGKYHHMAIYPDSRGFTLSGLLIVIAVLGMLATFAVPRFVYRQADAHAAAIQSLAGSVRTAAYLAHELANTQERPASVTMQGETIALQAGYPTAADIRKAVVGVAGFTFAPGVWTRNGARAPLQCSVRYVPPLRPGSVPQVDIDTRGC
ncbi:MAG: type II secretion system protein [Gammaproteobacteria bacterium]|nr:type II secretion system protein [Gammaproteobacteria bacterium]